MHWSINYLGKPYIEKEYDCASTFCEVMREVFDKDVPDYGERPRLRSQRYDKLLEELGEHAPVVTEPEEGDAVIMKSDRGLHHIGVWCVVNRDEMILHNLLGRGVVLTLPNDIVSVARVSVQEFRRWK